MALDRSLPGIQSLRHVVVLMMENRSFDHMLGALKAEDPRINGLTGQESNLDNSSEPARVQPLAAFQGQFVPDPDHHFPAVHKQLYFGTAAPPTMPSMAGFVQSYWDQCRDVAHSHRIMYYFGRGKLPVLHTLAREFAVFNGWFSSIPGPSLGNHLFAHYGTSFGAVRMDLSAVRAFATVYERLLDAGRTARVYYYDHASSTIGISRLMKMRPQIFATYPQFLLDCKQGTLPDYSFVEPNHTDHTGAGGGLEIACDQYPDHDVQAGEVFIASVYNAIRQNMDLWKSTALLVVYDEHGGIFDHVPPPACASDGFVALPDATGIGQPFLFDRLGVRVPAILISPWIAKRSVVPGPEDPANARIFEHASIPATVTQHFIGAYDVRSFREKAAQTFLDLLSDQMRPDFDCPVFDID
jgi:phospholipase C